MSLFEHFATADDSDGEESPKFGATHEQVQLVLDIIDASMIKTKYENAVSLFRDRIQCSDFKSVVAEGEAARTRTGLFIVESSPRESGVVSILALQRTPLKDLSDFFSAAGIVTDQCILPVFSPEEEIFAPYFNFLKIACGAVILQQHLRPLVLKAIRNVEEENFTDCVAAIGLGAEDVLTQIFESLYRAQLIRGLTIGQLADEIGARARSITKNPSPTEPELDDLYGEIKSAMADEALSTKRCVELTRTILTRLIEVQKYNRQQVQKLKQPERKASVWPPAIEYAVEELIRYRNAAAHKSRIPIGHTECRRAMHSLVMLHSWWEGEKRSIDWGLSPDEIVSRCVARASAG